MANLPDKITAEKENVEKVLAGLQAALEKELRSPLEVAGMAVFIHNIYNGIENILLQILKSKNIKVGKTEGWHKEIINLSVSHNIVTKELADNLFEYLTFRHYFVHAYGFTLEEPKLHKLASNAGKVWFQFVSEIGRYL